MGDDWVPFGLDDEAADRYRVLLSGVPQNMREPLLGWLTQALVAGHRIVNVERSHQLAMVTDLPLGVMSGANKAIGVYINDRFRRMPDDQLLRVTDAVLSLGWNATRRDNLEEILLLGRAKWSVGERMGKPGLVERVPEGVQDMVESTIASSGTAGQLLGRAWGKVRGLAADDPGAYFDAVKAVERVAKPLVEPDNEEATLGSIANVMRNQGDWRLPLREHDHAPTADMIVAMCRALYRGHSDRHAGSDDYRDVTHEEALAGVALAATLVSWFNDGLIQRRGSEG